MYLPQAPAIITVLISVQLNRKINVWSCHLCACLYTIQIGPVPPNVNGQVLAPLTKRKHPAPPPAFQNQPSTMPSKRVAPTTLEQRGRKKPKLYNLQQTKPRKLLNVYSPKLESHAALPYTCSSSPALQTSLYSTLHKKKRAALEQSQRKKPEFLSSIVVYDYYECDYTIL